MSEIIIGGLHRSVEEYVSEYGTGGLALVKYRCGAWNLARVENAGPDRYMLLTFTPAIDEEIEWLIDVEAMTISFGEIEA